MTKEIKQSQVLATFVADTIGRFAEGSLRRTETEIHLSHGFINRA